MPSPNSYRFNSICQAILILFVLLSLTSTFARPAASQTTTEQSKTEQSTEIPESAPSPELEQPDLKFRSQEFLRAKTVVFLGGSLTHGGAFIANIESTLLENYDSIPKIINLGLPAETCSGLTEPDHAFPRPNILDRIDRVLEKTDPDLVFACYGMEDGIFHPFDEKRFEAFQGGIRELIKRVDQHGSKIVLITPPPFDSEQLKQKGRLLKSDATGFTYSRVYENYDEEVISRYAAWLVELEKEESVFAVVDAYSVIKQFIDNQRSQDPNFTFSADGLHMHAAGHRVLAYSILEAFGFEQTIPEDKMFVSLIRERLAFSHMAWLTHVGHGHPKVRPGLSFEDLEIKLQLVNEKIEKYLAEHQDK